MSLDTITNEFVFHTLVLFTRVMAMFSFLPALREVYFSPRIRIVLAFLTCLVIYPILHPIFPKVPTHVSNIATILAIEFLVGALIGSSIKIYFGALDIVGNILSMNSSLSAANFFDNNQKTQQPIFSIFLHLLGVMAIFASDTHHSYFKGIVVSYDKFRVNETLIAADMAKFITNTFNEAFIVGFKIASPFIIVHLSMQIGTGVLSKLMPSLQIFFILLPAQMLAMFAVLLIIAPTLNFYIIEYINNFYIM